MSKKICNSCQTRSVGTGRIKGIGDDDAATARSVELCVPCLAEAGWENTHSDYGHDADATEITEQSGEDEVNKRVAGCWVCFPELNEAQQVKPARTASGTSRKGMKMTVPNRASGKVKAAVVAEALSGAGAEVKVRCQFGVYVLKATLSNGTEMELRWDKAGRYLYDASKCGARKVRNVAEALRLAV